MRDGRNKLEILDPNQSASISESLYCIMRVGGGGGGKRGNKKNIFGTHQRPLLCFGSEWGGGGGGGGGGTERGSVCLVLPTVPRTLIKMPRRRTYLTDYTDNI